MRKSRFRDEQMVAILREADRTSVAEAAEKSKVSERRRTRVMRIVPNIDSCLRLTRALCVETHETWLEDKRYLNMDVLWEATQRSTTQGGIALSP
jgi:transposase-like protein